MGQGQEGLGQTGKNTFLRFVYLYHNRFSGTVFYAFRTYIAL